MTEPMPWWRRNLGPEGLAWADTAAANLEAPSGAPSQEPPEPPGSEDALAGSNGASGSESLHGPQGLSQGQGAGNTGPFESAHDTSPPDATGAGAESAGKQFVASRQEPGHAVLDQPARALGVQGESREQMGRLRELLGAWMDRALTQEPPPAGLDPGLLKEMMEELSPGDCRGAPAHGPSVEGTDRYGVWSALTTLAQEVRLQARTFKGLKESLEGDVAGGIEDTLRQQQELLEAFQNRDGEERQRACQESGQLARKQAEAETVDLLLDLRDRLRRSLRLCESRLESMRTSRPPGWWARLLGSGGEGLEAQVEAVEALAKGVLLGSEQLDEALLARGIAEIPCLGQPFDPRLMKAVDIVAGGLDREGTVVEVFRPGYRQAEAVVRLAEVCVARGRAEG